MRFARQCTIFRGHLEPAPLVSVLFLLVLFLFLGTMVYTPGVVIDFDSSTGAGPRTITITKNDEVIFAGKTNHMADLERMREDDLRNSTVAPPFRLQVESGADPKLVQRVRDLFQISLPTADSRFIAGTDNPTVIVEVNFRGQCFFENQPVQDAGLQSVLRRRLQEAGHAGKKLTLVVAADKEASNEVIMRLYQLARQAGVNEIVLGAWSSDVGAPARRSHP